MERRKLILLISLTTLVVLCSGCSLFSKQYFVRGYLPVHELPERPQLNVVSEDQVKNDSENAARKLSENDIKLKTYARKLEIIANDYVDLAKEHNAKTDKVLGIDDGQN